MTNHIPSGNAGGRPDARADRMPPPSPDSSLHGYSPTLDDELRALQADAIADAHERGEQDPECDCDRCFPIEQHDPACVCRGCRERVERARLDDGELAREEGS